MRCKIAIKFGSGPQCRTLDPDLYTCRLLCLRQNVNRPAVGKVDKLCLTRGNTKKLQFPGQRMTCETQVPEPSIIYLLEESLKKLPKGENVSGEDQLQNSCPLCGECSRTPCLRNCHRMTQRSSYASNAMDLLNLINMKCTHLNKLGGKNENRVDTVSERRNDFNGFPKMMDNVPSAFVSCLASSNSEQDKKQLVDSERGTLVSSKKQISVTSHEIMSERRDRAPNKEHSSLSESTNLGSCVKRTPRKQKTPTKGVEKLDPSFQGIEFQMHLCFEKEKCDNCQLMVTSFFSRARSRRKSSKSKLRFKSTSLSSGSEDDQTPVASSKNKRCASCKTQKTPLWRDAEDGTPLCNACGIRYKKYGLRCGQCWNIPKKDGKSCSRYCRCGGMFRAHF